jgi:F420-dependent oxidoreductase-like protein
MQLCVFIEPHRGASFDAQLKFAKHVEERGFDGFFRADHYQAMGSSLGLPGPTDAWVTLGAIACATSRIRLGTLVTSITFRLPGPLAITVAQVDQMSGGRVELGLGAGWFEREHKSYGIPFPPVRQRFDQLSEQLEIVTGLWATPIGEHFTFAGQHYQLEAAPALPKPAQAGGPPIIVGGRGQRRTPRLAARFADEFNAAFQTPEEAAKQFQLVTDAVEALGRSTSERPMRLSIGSVVACGRTDAQARQRAAVLFEADSALPPEDPVIGPPSLLVDRIGEFAKLGVSRVYVRLTDLADLNHLDVIASDVLPQLDR